MPANKPSLFMQLANPRGFMGFANRAIAPLVALTLIVLIAGLIMSFNAPEDYQQGASVLIMFVHVPAVWLAMMSYSIMSASALGTLVWRHPLADIALRAALPLGAAFTFIGLVTGSLWGKPMWGTWWVWDARLTSFLVLLILYLGLMVLEQAIDEPSVAAKALAIVTLVGFVNIPIIKFSVDWWYTLHQPASVMRFDRPAMDIAFLYPLLVMALGFILLFFTLHLMHMRNGIVARRIRRLKIEATQ